jgi:hypothetical protein
LRLDCPKKYFFDFLNCSNLYIRKLRKNASKGFKSAFFRRVFVPPSFDALCIFLDCRRKDVQYTFLVVKVAEQKTEKYVSCSWHNSIVRFRTIRPKWDTSAVSIQGNCKKDIKVLWEYLYMSFLILQMTEMLKLSTEAICNF